MHIFVFVLSGTLSHRRGEGESMHEPLKSMAVEEQTRETAPVDDGALARKSTPGWAGPGEPNRIMHTLHENRAS